MENNPYYKFWLALNRLIFEQDQTLDILARLISAELDSEESPEEISKLLQVWYNDEFPPQTIAILIALLDLADCELVIAKKEAPPYNPHDLII